MFDRHLANLTNEVTEDKGPESSLVFNGLQTNLLEKPG